MYTLIYFVLFTALLFASYKLGKQNKKYHVILGKITVFALLIYITWRIFFTIPTDNGIGIFLGTMLICFEILGIFQSIMMAFLFSSKNNIEIEKNSFFESPPTIDIFICTYNEPIEILQRTIVSASSIKYAKGKLKVYVGDDGKRDEVKRICKKYKVNYVTRDNNLHAKAGNLNNLLRIGEGEFCLVLDADFIPKQNIIDRMLPFFEDSAMGFVQAPQVFYNLDPFQHNLGFNNKLPNEQDFFMGSICKKRSYNNATLQLGTNTLFRKKALVEIGLIPTGSITEDMATGMLIQNAGYKSFFINECLAIGLAVESFADYVKQRDRWARGNIQVMKKYGPFRQKNLNLKQKLIYLSGALYWLFGLQKMVYIIFPIIYLLFNVPILYASSYELLLFFIPSYIGSMLYYRAISNNTRSLLWSNIYDTSIAPQMALSVLKEFFFKSVKKLKFNVTPKGKVNDKTTFNIRLAFIHICLLLLTITALVFAVIKLSSSSFTSPEFYGLLIAAFWVSYNFIPLLVSIFLVIEKPRIRSTVQIEKTLNVNLVTKKEKKQELSYFGTTIHISEANIKILLDKFNDTCELSDNDLLYFQIENVGKIRAQVIKIYEKNDRRYLTAKFINVRKTAINKINQLRFENIEGYAIKPQYAKQNVISLMSIIIFEKFAFKNNFD